MAYGFNEDKSKEEIYSKTEIIAKLAGGGKFVKYQSTATLTKNTPYEVGLKVDQVQNIFGTDDTSKIHIVATDMFRTVESPQQGYQIRAWAQSFYYNQQAGVTYTIPFVEMFDKDTYPWVDDRLIRIWLYNPTQQLSSETVTWRIFAFVED